MKCSLCKKNDADFRSKGAQVIRTVCAKCVWIAEIRKETLGYELVPLPVKKEEKNAIPRPPHR